MSSKLASFALPLSLVLMFAPAITSHAATPIATFGVSATVAGGCSVSGAMFHGTVDAAVKNATSVVSVKCSDTTQYSIVVIPMAAPGAAVKIGNLNFPLRTLTSYAMSSGATHNLKWGGVAASEPAGEPSVALAADADFVSVAITY